MSDGKSSDMPCLKLAGSVLTMVVGYWLMTAPENFSSKLGQWWWYMIGFAVFMLVMDLTGWGKITPKAIITKTDPEIPKPPKQHAGPPIACQRPAGMGKESKQRRTT